VSIAFNPLLFAAVEPARAWARSRSSLARRLEQRDDPLAELPMSTDQSRLTGQVVLVGYGRVGRRIADALAEQQIPYVVAEQNRGLVRELRASDIAAVSGDASDPAVLIQAHIARAAMLVIAVTDTLKARAMVKIARTLNPAIETVLRTHNEDEADLLRRETLGAVFLGERELALGMARHVSARLRAESAVSPQTTHGKAG
jgi:CPA2 family monovalent cation:H+ antiporter-2